MRVAVVGHVEWVDFVRVERLPSAGDITHAQEAWAEPAGGGAVSACVLAALAGECSFLTALGDDELGRRSQDELARLGVRGDAVYFTGGDAEALRAARTARVLVATARELPTLLEAAVELDALVHSAGDPGERYAPGSLDPPPRLVVSTAGAAGGVFSESGGDEHEYAVAAIPGPILDAYGSGDSFAAGLTYALG